MLDHPPFYHGSIRKYTAAIGNLFDNISVMRENDIRKVPLAYETRDQFLQRINQRSSIDDNVKVKMTLPRLSFNLEGVTYDSERARSKHSSIASANPSTGNRSQQYQFSPWNFQFSVNAYANSIVDILQILEQVTPFFNPHYYVNVKDNPLLPNDYSDIPIYLESVNMVNDVEGSFSSDKRYHVLEMQLLLKGQIFGPFIGGLSNSDDSNSIKHSIIDFYDMDDQRNLNLLITRYEAEVIPETASENDEHEIQETQTDF